VEDPRVRTKKFVLSINKGEKGKEKKRNRYSWGQGKSMRLCPPRGSARWMLCLPGWQLALSRRGPRLPPVGTGRPPPHVGAARASSRALTARHPRRASATPPSLSHDWALPGLGFPLLARLAIQFQHDACSGGRRARAQRTRITTRTLINH